MDLPSLTQILEAVSGWIRGGAEQFLGAAAWLLGGWALASLCSSGARRIVATVSGRVETSIEKRGALRGAGLWRSAPRVIGRGVYWTILLCFATAAFEKLSVPFAAELLQDLAYFLPKVLLALVLVFAGASLGSLAHHWVSDMAAKAGIASPGILGRMAQAAILAVALIVGVQQIGVQGSIFVSMATVVLASTLGGMALAFGLGSSPVVANIMASHYASKALSVGDVVRSGKTEGTVREITPTSIVIDVGADRLYLPARKYCDEPLVVVGRD